MTKVRHVLGISGGKDSAALAIYMKQKYPTLEVEYYNSDTGCELEETEKLVNNLESFLGKIERLKAAEGSPEPTPFDHFLKISGGYLPSPQARWCTNKMKLAEFKSLLGMSLQFLMLVFVEMKIEKVMFRPNLTFRLYSHLEEIYGVLMLYIKLYIMIIWI